MFTDTRTEMHRLWNRIYVSQKTIENISAKPSLGINEGSDRCSKNFLRNLTIRALKYDHNGVL